MPELPCTGRAGGAHLTLCAVAGAGADRERLGAPGARLGGAERDAAAPGGSAPDRRGPDRQRPPPGAFERSVARAVERIRAGELDKVVLAREVVVDAPRAHDSAALYGALREQFPSCFCVCCGSPEAAFLAPARSSWCAARARARRRSRSPARPGEAPTRRSTTTSASNSCARPRTGASTRSSSVGSSGRSAALGLGGGGPEPGLVKVANIQHLATPIHAQLSEPRSAVELAGILHPTPAVGGEPRDRALEVITELEGLDRGWYAGPVGWMDAAEDGEFCVALRSALLRDRDGPSVRGRRDRRRLRPGRRARRDRAQARGDAAASSAGQALSPR